MNPATAHRARLLPSRTPARQRGAVQLFITSVLLLVAVMLGITAAVVSNSQYRMVGNIQLENIAFGLAESAAANAETWLYTAGNNDNPGFGERSDATPHLYPIGYLANNNIDPLTMTWSSANSLAVGGDDTTRYLIEKIGDNNLASGAQVNLGGRALSGCQRVDIFRVTARGTSAKGTVKLIQTTVTIPTC